MSISDSTLPIINPAVWQGLSVMFAADPGELEELVGEFDRASRAHLLRIESACAEGDCGAAERVAHSLKSSSGYLGATRLQALCGDFEAMARDGEIATLRPLLPELAEAVAQSLAAIRDLMP